MMINALSIAGIDPSGGAGIYADLKTFSALGAYGMGVVTALTAQNTQGVSGVYPIPVDFVRAQLDSLFSDVRIDVIKVGMLGTPALASTIARSLRNRRHGPLVVDPVMVAKSGHALLTPDAVATLRREILPLADVVTPNLPEAAVLLDRPVPRNLEEMKTMARDLAQLGPKIIVLKGGHLEGAESQDVVDIDGHQEILTVPRVSTRNTHGTGCTLSAAIAALLPLHPGNPLEAIRAAKVYLTGALLKADTLEVGHGHGPVHHFHAVWDRS